VNLQILELLTFPEDSVGRIMTTEFISFRKEQTVTNATKKIRSMAGKRIPVSYRLEERHGKEVLP